MSNVHEIAEAIAKHEGFELPSDPDDRIVKRLRNEDSVGVSYVRIETFDQLLSLVWIADTELTPKGKPRRVGDVQRRVDRDLAGDFNQILDDKEWREKFAALQV